MQSNTDYNNFLSQFYCNDYIAYSPDQGAAIIYGASITYSNYGWKRLEAFSNPKRLTFTKGKVMASHVHDGTFASSATYVPSVLML